MPDEAAAPAGESHAAPPSPASDAPAVDEAQNEWDATAAHNDAMGARGARDDELDKPDAQDSGHVRGAQDAEHLRAEQDADRVRGAKDDCRARKARDADHPREGPDGWVAHEVEMRRRDAERRLWPTGPPAYPAAWSGPG